MNRFKNEESYLLLLGARIKQIRNDKGITQEELAERMNTSSPYIGNVERGQKNITLSSLFRFADALNVRVMDLFAFEAFSDTGIVKPSELAITEDKMLPLIELLSQCNTADRDKIYRMLIEFLK
ncbi:XRE family transcriptional regulator [Paenibacillus chitinolyticus]|uniref:Helix-turn-helix domain-containing protein n=1 Tax=Paenibacillus chitinolyticus TaxID=79263 RepID=A0A410WWR1_9BACL|nr:helix-turn-helix transcriptional regulator [Paenibacillus chitinolyticus]MCY9594144.1 helix-turn-helix domain-containing protein [Paenibacillus chitinolyticus]MCY9599649.1 helix-turn-helix domain-containing protein [Paenibacillus chitinolyticus]QAV18848.1 XRE family transcriptional regulator [Paenibacillus chitinolyticus]